MVCLWSIYGFSAYLLVFTPKAAALFVAAVVGLFCFRHDKAQLLTRRPCTRRRALRARRAHGRALHQRRFAGEVEVGVLRLHALSPDISPPELDKIGSVVGVLRFLPYLCIPFSVSCFSLLVLSCLLLASGSRRRWGIRAKTPFPAENPTSPFNLTS